MNASVEKERQRIINAALSRLKKKTGGDLLIVKMPKGGIETIQVTREFMKSLLLRFEDQFSTEFNIRNRSERQREILKVYGKATGISGSTEYLTDTGKFIVDGIFEDAKEDIRKGVLEGMRQAAKSAKQ